MWLDESTTDAALSIARLAPAPKGCFRFRQDERKREKRRRKEGKKKRHTCLCSGRVLTGPENISSTLSSPRLVGSTMHEKRGEQPSNARFTPEPWGEQGSGTTQGGRNGHRPLATLCRQTRRATGSLDRGCGANFPERPGISSRPPTDTSSARLFGSRQPSHPRSSISPRHLPAPALPLHRCSVESRPIGWPTPKSCNQHLPAARHHWRTPIRLTTAPLERTRRLHRSRQ